MKHKSRSAKGRYLQNIVKQKIFKLYPSLTKKDIRTSMNGENSADIKLLTTQNEKNEIKLFLQKNNLISFFEDILGLVLAWSCFWSVQLVLTNIGKANRN